MHPGFSARIFFETFYLPERRIPDYGKETILACGMPLPYLRISGFSECRVLWSERCLKHNAYTVRWYVLAMAMSLIDHYSLVGQASMKLRCPAQWSSWAYLWAAYSLQAKEAASCCRLSFVHYVYMLQLVSFTLLHSSVSLLSGHCGNLQAYWHHYVHIQNHLPIGYHATSPAM